MTDAQISSMIITDKLDLMRFGARFRLWQGIPSVAVTERGRIFCTFYSGGIKEQLGNYCVLKKCDGGVWSDVIASVYAGENYRTYDPCLWVDPLKRLWWIFSVMPEHAVYAVIASDPDADEIKWSKPFMIGHDVMLNKPVVLSSGEWLFPLAVWDKQVFSLRDVKSNQRDRKAFVYKSVDNGKTFKKIGGTAAKDRSFDEHMLVEMTDGSIAMYIRTHYGIACSRSFDGGCSWTEPVNSGLKGPDSRFFIGRLKSGRLLLVNHHNFTGRNNLTAMLSEDDGRTWKGFLTLDERSEVSYPDCAEGEDGFIYIVYDRERGAFLKKLKDCLGAAREILMAKITEEDILAGKIVTQGSRLKTVIDKLGEYEGEDKNPFAEYGDCGKEDYARILAQQNNGSEILDKIFRDYGKCCLALSAADRLELDKNCAYLQSEEAKADAVGKVVAINKIISLMAASESEGYEAFYAAVAERIRKAAEQNIKNPDFDLDFLSANLGISKFYMCHLFKKITGTTIVKYINFLKAAKAKKLLVETDRSLLSVCMEVGFADTDYFSKWFKKQEGISPSAYRKLNSRAKK